MSVDATPRPRPVATIDKLAAAEHARYLAHCTAGRTDEAAKSWRRLDLLLAERTVAMRRTRDG